MKLKKKNIQLKDYMMTKRKFSNLIVAPWIATKNAIISNEYI